MKLPRAVIDIGIGAVLVLSLAARSLQAQAPADGQLTVSGSAALENDPAAARQRAIEDALRRAIEQVAGVHVEAETLTRHYQVFSDRILTRTRGYVREFEVLRETQSTDRLMVDVRVRVATDLVVSDLRSVGLLVARKRYPRVGVLVQEQMTEQLGKDVVRTSGSFLETAMLAQLGARRIPAVAPPKSWRQPTAQLAAFDDARLRKEGAGVGAEVLILGDARIGGFTDAGANGFMSATAAGALRAIDIDTGQLLASANGSATGAGVSNEGAAQAALERLGKQLGDRLLEQLLNTWVEQTSNAAPVELEVSGLRSYPQLAALKAQLSALPGARDVIERVGDVTTRSASLEWRGELTAGDLARLISAHRFDGFQVVVTGTTANRIRIQLKEKN
jgi:hypothetical protein